MVTTYISVTETAKLVREALKKAFPRVKFSVRSKSYSGGASIDVYWTDGPRTCEVKRITQRFNGADFDGMQDLKTNRQTLVSQPDGTVKQVQYGADWVFCHREYSPARRAKLEAEIAAVAGEPFESDRVMDAFVSVETGEVFKGRGIHPGDSFGSSLFHRLAEQRSFKPKQG